jgi:hypothetical protein
MSSVVVGDQAALDRWPRPPSCAIWRGHGQQPLGGAGGRYRRWRGRRGPCRFRSSSPLRVSLADSIHCRIQPMDRRRGASSRRSGRTRCKPSPGSVQVLELPAREPLSPIRIRPGRRPVPGRVRKQSGGGRELPILRWPSATRRASRPLSLRSGRCAVPESGITRLAKRTRCHHM